MGKFARIEKGHLHNRKENNCDLTGEYRIHQSPMRAKKELLDPESGVFFTEKSFTKLICPSPLISSYRNLDTTATELPFLYLGCENQSDFANFREIRIDAPCTYYKIYMQNPMAYSQLYILTSMTIHGFLHGGKPKNCRDWYLSQST